MFRGLRATLLLTLALIVGGCHRMAAESRDGNAKVAGGYSGKFMQDDDKARQGADLYLDESHRFRLLMNNLVVTGSWTATGNQVTFLAETYGGKPIEEVKKLLLDRAKGGKSSAAFKSMAENIDKPMTLTASPDGRTLTGEKDPRAHGYTVYTKS